MDPYDRAPGSADMTHAELVFGAAPSSSGLDMATGGCDCGSNCACDPDLVTFNYADGKSAVDTNMTAKN